MSASARRPPFRPITGAEGAALVAQSMPLVRTVWVRRIVSLRRANSRESRRYADD